jgi:hypothetical protein
MLRRSVADPLTFACHRSVPSLAEQPYPMSSNNIDHSEHCFLDHSSQTDTSKTDGHEVNLLDDDLIRWLPLLAANDFLEEEPRTAVRFITNDDRPIWS